MRVFVDSSVFITWLNKNTPEYSDIEKIRGFTENKKIEIVVSPDILWEITNGKNGSADEAEIIKKWKINKIVMIDPDAVIGDSNGSYAAKLAKSRVKWKRLSSLIYDKKDSKHSASADFGYAEYYLTLDDKHINKMRNEANKYLTNTKFIKPCELLKIIINKSPLWKI